MTPAPFRLPAPAKTPPRRFSRAAALAGTLALLLSGCAAADYPSLAIRPAERISGTAAPAAPLPVASLTPPPPPSASVTGRAAQLVAQAETAHRRFQARQDETRRLVSGARGAAVASDSWSAANIALSSLESARSDAMIALAELDALYASESVAAESPNAAAEASANVASLVAARDTVSDLVQQEDAVLASLRGTLRN